MKRSPYKSGVGSTKELSLRVSVASLVRVLFKNPSDGNMMIALERTATLIKDRGNSVVMVRAKPFGGAARIHNVRRFKELVGDFRFDSKRSQEEHDFRIQIHPDGWEKVKEVCQEHLNDQYEMPIETGPARELSEEFMDSLLIRICPADYDLTPLGVLIEDRLTATNNINAWGKPTKRIYFLYEAILKNPMMIDMIMNRQGHYSDQDLRELAYNDAVKGGKGRANGILVMYVYELEKLYRTGKNAMDGDPVEYMGHQLDGNVPAILNKGWL